MKRPSSTLEERGKWLRHCPLFAELDSTDLGVVAGLSSLHSYAAGEILFHGGTPAGGLHVVVEGLVKVCRYGTDGREQVLHLFGPGEPCGEVALFGGRTYPATAQAVNDTRTLCLDRNDFLEAARNRPEMLLNMLGVLSMRLRRFVDLIDDLSLKEVSTRLARRLFDMAAGKEGDTVALQVSKSTLAAQIGTVPETLSRTLTRMQQRGVLRVTGKEIVIANRKALEALAEGEKL